MKVLRCRSVAAELVSSREEKRLFQPNTRTPSKRSMKHFKKLTKRWAGKAKAWWGLKNCFFKMHHYLQRSCDVAVIKCIIHEVPYRLNPIGMVRHNYAHTNIVQALHVD